MVFPILEIRTLLERVGGICPLQLTFYVVARKPRRTRFEGVPIGLRRKINRQPYDFIAELVSRC